MLKGGYAKTATPAVGQEHINFMSPEFVSYTSKKRGAVWGKRLIFLYTSPYEHVENNV